MLAGIDHGWCRWYAPKSSPFTIQSLRPKAFCILGRSRPRKSSSSPRTVLNTNIATMMANNPQLPCSVARPAAEPRNAPKSWLATVGSCKGRSCSTKKPAANGRTPHSHNRPPRRFAVDGGRSHSASRRIGQRRPLRSHVTRITTSRNCHTNPAHSATMSTWVKRRALGAGPASAGATSQANAAIGRAAATHTASTLRREYCLFESWVLVGTALTEDVTVISGPLQVNVLADQQNPLKDLARQFHSGRSTVGCSLSPGSRNDQPVRTV